MKLILFDDHILFGKSLKCLLLENELIEVFDFVSDEVIFFNKIQKESYDILLLDINFKQVSKINGFEMIPKIREVAPNLKIVILSSYDMPLYKKKAFECGAMDFINKSETPEALIERLNKVLDKDRITYNFNDIAGLTPREIEVLQEICKGRTKRDAAKALFLSERTLYNHLQSIYQKLGVNSLVEAYNRAIKLGYIDPLM